MARSKVSNRATVSIFLGCFFCDDKGSGRSSAIFRTNSTNVITIRKNFIKKGRHTDPIGSNVHS